MLLKKLLAAALLSAAALPASATGVGTPPKTYSGTIQATLAVQVKSTFAANQSFLCTVSFYVYDPLAGTQAVNATATIAQTASAGMVKCTVNIPYSVSLAPSDTIRANATWQVSADLPNDQHRLVGGGFMPFSPEATSPIKLTGAGAI